jgi:hypothetical protein
LDFFFLSRKKNCLTSSSVLEKIKRIEADDTQTQKEKDKRRKMGRVARNLEETLRKAVVVVLLLPNPAGG